MRGTPLSRGAAAQSVLLLDGIWRYCDSAAHQPASISLPAAAPAGVDFRSTLSKPKTDVHKLPYNQSWTASMRDGYYNEGGGGGAA